MDKVKGFKITPSGNTSFDSIIVKSGKTWREALTQVEASLEEQFLDDDIPWAEIKVTVECIEMTEEEYDELEVE